MNVNHIISYNFTDLLRFALQVCKRIGILWSISKYRKLSRRHLPQFLPFRISRNPSLYHWSFYAAIVSDFSFQHCYFLQSHSCTWFPTPVMDNYQIFFISVLEGGYQLQAFTSLREFLYLSRFSSILVSCQFIRSIVS